MSTYLVAFVVSDFASKSVGNFSVWAREGAIVSAEYTLDIGPKILDYFAEFYQIKYPLPKMDMVALPDFNAGAMENWGLVTFRYVFALVLSERGVSVLNRTLFMFHSGILTWPMLSYGSLIAWKGVLRRNISISITVYTF